MYMYKCEERYYNLGKVFCFQNSMNCIFLDFLFWIVCDVTFHFFVIVNMQFEKSERADLWLLAISHIQWVCLPISNFLNCSKVFLLEIFIALQEESQHACSLCGAGTLWCIKILMYLEWYVQCTGVSLLLYVLTNYHCLIMYLFKQVYCRNILVW